MHQPIYEEIISRLTNQQVHVSGWRFEGQSEELDQTPATIELTIRQRFIVLDFSSSKTSGFILAIDMCPHYSSRVLSLCHVTP